jgi:serine/threonine protein kinase
VADARRRYDERFTAGRHDEKAMVGRTISHYRVLSQLGAGGMGVVYRAEYARLGREVAIKFVSEDGAHGEQAVHRLRSEARAASALNHPNICTIYDIGEDEGHPFIVMELMGGQMLRDRLLAGPLKVHQLVDIGIEISDAPHATHSDGIIHRDIKPGNIFLTDPWARQSPRLRTGETDATRCGSATTT